MGVHVYRVIQNLAPPLRAENETTLEKPIVEPYSTSNWEWGAKFSFWNLLQIFQNQFFEKVFFLAKSYGFS